MTTARTLKTKQQIGTVTALLQSALAETIALRLAAKQAHWNVKGENFIALHELFDKVAAEVDGYADLLAERAVQLGEIVAGTLQEAGRRSKLVPYPADISEAQVHVRALGGAIRLLAESLRPGINTSTAENDMVTADLLTEVVRGLDKLCWLVELHLPAR